MPNNSVNLTALYVGITFNLAIPLVYLVGNTLIIFTGQLMKQKLNLYKYMMQTMCMWGFQLMKVAPQKPMQFTM